MGEGVKKLRASPLTLPSPARGEGKYIEIQEEIPSPSRGEGQGGGEIRDLFTASLPPGEGIYSGIFSMQIEGLPPAHRVSKIFFQIEVPRCVPDEPAGIPFFLSPQPFQDGIIDL